MEFENLITLIKTVSESKLTGFKYEERGVKINLSKQAGQVQVISQGEKATGEASAQVQTLQTALTWGAAGAEASAETGTSAPESESAVGNIGGNVIESPLVGTFYTAPSEDAEPFVAVGDTVKKGQTLAIVEAMKLMNEIESEYDGTVTQILVKNGEPVQYGQPLFKIS